MTITTAQNTRTTRPLLYAAILGPILFLIGQALLPSLPNDLAKAFPLFIEHRDQLMAARLLTAAGAFLLAPAALVYASAAGRPATKTVLVGSTMFAIGTFFNALSQAVAGYATYAATDSSVDQDAGMAVFDQLGRGLVGLPIGFWSIPMFAIGAIVMAIGLLRTRRTPIWMPVLLIIGPVLAGATAGLGPIVALTQLPVTVALIALSLHAVKENRGAPASREAH